MSHDVILNGLNMTLEPGKHTLIKGESGLGKSTLFKVFANTWQHGQGQVTRPAKHEGFFLSQELLLPNTTLKAILAYPESINTYPKEAYINVLRLVKLGKLITELDSQASWIQRLSGGEQQRLVFARALLKKPKWLFMDESTSALDESNERLIYRLIKSELPNTTIVSIAHKSSVEKYHDRIFTIQKDAVGQAQIQEKTIAYNDDQWGHLLENRG